MFNCCLHQCGDVEKLHEADSDQLPYQRGVDWGIKKKLNYIKNTAARFQGMTLGSLITFIQCLIYSGFTLNVPHEPHVLYRVWGKTSAAATGGTFIYFEVESVNDNMILSNARRGLKSIQSPLSAVICVSYSGFVICGRSCSGCSSLEGKRLECPVS